jgi:hypothetical protein
MKSIKEQPSDRSDLTEKSGGTLGSGRVLHPYRRKTPEEKTEHYPRTRLIET